MQQQPMNRFGGRSAGQDAWTQGNADGSGYAGVNGAFPQQQWPQNSGGQPAYPQGNSALRPPQGFGQAQQGTGYGQMQQPQGFGQAQQGTGYGQMQQAAGYAQPQAQPYPQQEQPQNGMWGGQDPNGWQQVPTPAWPEDVYQGQKKRFLPKITPNLILVVLAVGVMPLIFLTALLVRTPVMTIIAAGLGIGMLVTLWMSDVYERPTTLMISVLYAVAIAVAVILTLTAGGTKDSARQASGQTPAPAAGFDESDPDGIGQLTSAAETPVPTTPEPQQNDASIAASDRFFYYWKNNNLDSMVNVCSRAWTQSLSSGSDPKSKLFEIQRQRKVVSYEYVSVTGSINDSRRTVTYRTEMIPPGGSSAQRYITKIDVVFDAESGMWYVDPRSLESNTPTATPTQASIFATQPPDPAPADASTVLYYNPDGGTMYHIDPNCESAKKEYLPFKGHFTYAQINDPAYVDLKPCNRCGAPRRPK